MKNYTALQKMAYGFAASRQVSFVSKYDHPDRWFKGYLVLSESPETPLSEILAGLDTEDRDRDAMLMDIELEAELLLLYFQDLLVRLEAGLMTLADGADTLPVSELDVNTLIELGSD